MRRTSRTKALGRFTTGLTTLSRMTLSVIVVVATVSAISAAEKAKTPEGRPRAGDRMVAEYFRNETRKLADACLSGIETLDD
ncbi:MAG TPA: hypothetical protein EYP14_04285, partial [Planctomycetaceae bacterium]|nr:hypothetical protein [Planctomycetaceae bacterium]